MKLWLDDLHPAPDGWVWLKTAQDFIDALQTYNGNISEISLDHDLGDSKQDGTWLCNWIETQTHIGTLYPILKWHVHSANPVGKARMETILRNADRFWDSHYKM